MPRQFPVTSTQPEREAMWPEKMRRRLAWLRDIGVMGKVHIDVQPDGLPGFHGMPQEEMDSFLPAVTGPVLVARALRDPRNHPLMGGPITILKGIDPDTHVAWRHALHQLVALCTSDTKATSEDVTAILRDARKSYLADWDELTYFLDTAKQDYRHVLNPEEPVRAWLAQCVARMFGVQTPSEPDVNWWATAREHVELGNDERFFGLTDLAWRRLLEAVPHFERDGHHKKAKIAAEKVIDLVDEFFQREKNMPICDLMDNAVFEDDP
ncbi:hypothetical protein NCS57_00464500 [Fusarium keratoplasticum]|uniref:Uncharacterized protein n=1 Tax=Fusarium keratoplasticum TaxID=1328300 RepID=A0ACC0R696_9HYPO|nr:hypothetical protein NCS57_00464500 [Fusarium keratoplasticum]KAI8675628.1 hypothetical protein NCS57_00464500 [Fusarium keratoplasticum]